MKITRIGPSFPLLTASTLGGGGGTITPSVGSGLVPVSNGSNAWAWSSNVQTISAGGSNVTGPFVNFAAGSNVTLTIDQVGSVASNTIRIHATSGTASFGSNSNAVSQANAPGASTDSSRADHVHLGVRSLSHSSNTFSGPVILTASGTLGITSPTPGTFDLTAGSGGGGGGGGAPTTAKYVTTAADGTLSAEVVRPQIANYFNDTPPTSANATYDDEFDDGSGMSGTVNGLAAKWAWRNQGTSTATYGKAGWITLNCQAQAATNIRIIEIAAFADGTYEMRATLEGVLPVGVSKGNGGGIALVDSANGDMYLFGTVHDDTLVYAPAIQRYTNVTTFNSNPALTTYGTLVPFPTMYLRVVKSGTTLEFWWSPDGIGWSRRYTETDAVSATRIGIFVNEYANLGLTKLHVDYFRKVA